MRVVIGEDEALLRRGLTLILEGAGFLVAGAAADAVELVEMAAAHRPDMVITDVRMPPSHTDEGMVAALALARNYPSMSIVVLSQHVQRRYAVELLAEKRRGIGYLLKQRIGDVDISSWPTSWQRRRRSAKGPPNCAAASTSPLPSYGAWCTTSCRHRWWNAAATKVVVRLDEMDGTLMIEVTDNGRGGASREGGTGLRGLVDRVDVLGGTFTLFSPVGSGTTISVRLAVSRDADHPDGLSPTAVPIATRGIAQ